MKRFVIFLMLLSSCSYDVDHSEINYSNLDNPQIAYVKINEIDIAVELATTEKEQMLGLMRRESLEGGMLFLYDEEKQRDFWMKNMLIPLDIIFIDKNNTITAIHRAVPCEQDPCRIYSGNAKYVLEVNANFTAENSISKRDKAMFIKRQ